MKDKYKIIYESLLSQTNAWHNGSAQQFYLRDPGSKPRRGLFFSSELLHSRLIFFSELIHLYKTFNTSWNNKKWCSAVERWVPHILRTRDRIPLFLCFLFIPGACSPPFFFTTGGPARQRRKQRGLPRRFVPLRFFFSLFLFNKETIS